MSRRLWAGGLIILFLIFSGCAGPTVKWTYPPPESKGLKALHEIPALPLKVAVLPFRERRSNENSNLSWIHFIPIVPYGWMDYDQPEQASSFMTISGYTANPLEDFPQALAKSLKEANLFQDVFFTYGGDLEKADLLIAGEVVSTHYNGKLFSWCLSFIGPEFAIFGFPKYSSENQLEINLIIRNVKGEKNLWAYTFSRSWSVTQGYYYNWGRDMDGYPMLLQEGVSRAILALNEKITRESLGYWQVEKRSPEDFFRRWIPDAGCQILDTGL